MESNDLDTALNFNAVNFDMLFYQSPEPMLIFDIENLQIQEVNDAALECYGYTREEILKLNIRSLRTEEQLSSFDELVPQFKAGKSVYTEARHLTRSGSIIHVDIVSYVIEYNKKECRLAHIHDVSSKVKQAQNLQVLLSICTSITDDLDLQSILQKVVNASARLSGAGFGVFYYKTYSRKGEVTELCATSGESQVVLEKICSAEAIDAYNNLLSFTEPVRINDLNQLSRNRSFQEINALIGETTSASYMTVPVISKSKAVLGILLFGHPEKDVFDIEAEKLALAVSSQAAIALDNAALFMEVTQTTIEKEALLEKAREQSFKKDEFLSIASHELKTPVTSMKGYLQLLEKAIQKSGNDFNSNLINKANGQVDKLVRLVSELLNFSKLESGKMAYHFTHFSITELVEDCIGGITSIKDSHKIKMYGDFDCVIHADKSRIEQVVTNLIDNAIKYSPSADEVLIGMSKKAGFFKFEVRDFGGGIDQEKLPLIFERYYRGEDNSFRSSGLGLGLYISSEIIKKHQGEIGASSEVGKGSTFWFSIPLSQLNINTPSR